MTGVVCAIFAAFVAVGATGLLAQYAWVEWRLYLFTWTAGMAGLSLALAAMTWGSAAGYGPVMFRIVEVAGALIAPLALALGVVDLAGRTVQLRFVARLVIGTYVFVAAIILVLDPVTGKFGTSLPDPGDHYTGVPPMPLLAGAHVLTVVILIASVASTAVRVRSNDPDALDIMLPVAIIALADVFVVVAARAYLPGPLTSLILGGAAVAAWYGAVRAGVYGPPPEEYDDPHETHAAHGVRPEPYAQPAGPYAQPPEPQAEERVWPREQPAQHEEETVRPRSKEPAFLPPPTPSDPGAQYLSDLLGPVAGAAGGGVPAGPGVSAETSPDLSGVSQAPFAMFALITVYVLVEGREMEFDRLVYETIEAVRSAEPDSLIYTSHTVASASSQRICYQLFRDAAAFEEHQRQPHTQRFLTEVRPHVTSVNVIELNLNAAKVVAVPSLNGPAAASPAPQGSAGYPAPSGPSTPPPWPGG